MNRSVSGCLSFSTRSKFTNCWLLLLSRVKRRSRYSWSSGPYAPRRFSRLRPPPTPTRSRWPTNSAAGGDPEDGGEAEGHPLVQDVAAASDNLRADGGFQDQSHNNPPRRDAS